MLLLVVVVAFLVLAVLKVYSKLSLGRCKSPACLMGKTALITGGNSGLGYQTALALAGRGCRVIIADRDNCEFTKRTIIEETGNPNIVIKHFDLSSLSSVRELARDLNETEERLEILINNAGTTNLGNRPTTDGLHVGMQVNHFGSFLLTHLLVDLLKKSAPSRIIFVSSIAAFFSDLSEKNLNFPNESPSNFYSEFMVYSNSKLCNLITARGFAQKLANSGVTSNALHPGIVCTPIFDKYIGRPGASKYEKGAMKLLLNVFLKMYSKDAEEGAQTAIHLAMDKEVGRVTGKYFIDCQPFWLPMPAQDRLFSDKIWKASEKYVGLTSKEKL